MKKITNWLPILAFVVGFLMIYGGSELSLPVLIHAGLIPIGIAVMVWGADAIITRRSDYTYGEELTSNDRYTGFAAIADGTVLLIVGFAIVAAGFVLLLGMDTAVLIYIKARTGIALLFGGMLAVVYGLTLMLGSNQDNCGGLRTLASIPARILGLVLLTIGAGAALMGVLEMLLPHLYQDVLDTLIGFLPQMPDFDH